VAEGGWEGELALASGWALFVGRAGESARHAHQALQLCVGGDAPFEVGSGEGPPRRVAAAAIAANAVHAVAGGGARAALLYLDSQSSAGRAVARALGSHPVVPAPRAAAAALRERVRHASGLDAAAARSLRDAIAACWSGTNAVPACAGSARRRSARTAPATAGSSRVGSAARSAARETPREETADARVAATAARIRALVAAPGGAGGLAAAELARAAGVSESRLAALFRREAGVAIRPFVLWTRLQRAVEVAAAGASLTEAAHAAGFADSAHLARTFRRMFGTTLSGTVARLRVVVLRD